LNKLDSSFLTLQKDLIKKKLIINPKTPENNNIKTIKKVPPKLLPIDIIKDNNNIIRKKDSSLISFDESIWNYNKESAKGKKLI